MSVRVCVYASVRVCACACCIARCTWCGGAKQYWHPPTAHPACRSSVATVVSFARRLISVPSGLALLPRMYV